ncbi:MAG: GAF domain-containing protein [Phycisphaerae bacterium]|nr:GAF domain-containing protein [Fodinibius sp.]NIU59883.1 GAF domain-containing protein [Phycisphaerae bacterium]NIV13156.1 GAF domain-containing protein [Fodinibius sp.]NIY26820.1 GAF domain-containing protein [Fodinibius sp.]
MTLLKSQNKSEAQNLDETHVSKLEALIESAIMLGQQSDFQEVLRLVAQKAASLMQADVVLIMMINPQTRDTVKTIYTEGKEVSKQDYHFVHANISGWVIENNRAFLTLDLKKDSRFRKDIFKGIPIKPVMCVPLRIESTTIGTLLLLSESSKASFSEEGLSYLEKFAAIVSPFLRNVQEIQRYFQAHLPEQALLAKYEAIGLLGKSKKFIELLQALEAAARCDVRVLLEGKTGTGKELIARAIHKFSARGDGPFMAIDCGAIPQNLLESELFGHKKGAFTGADFDRKGLLAEADGGSLFMDEINNLPIEMQAKLMRVLQEGEVRPLGSSKTTKVDVRFIAASSIPLRKLVDSGEFREDLFFRLHVYPISVPDLNERREDISLLANHFLKTFSEQQKKKASSFHEDVLDFIKQRPWPGNIRELENFVERLVTVAPPDASNITADMFPPDLYEELSRFHTKRNSLSNSKSLREQLQTCEAQIIKQALIECHWNQSKAARKLRTSEKNIRYKIKKLNIKKSSND